jgi:hypothetical protein
MKNEKNISVPNRFSLESWAIILLWGRIFGGGTMPIIALSHTKTFEKIRIQVPTTLIAEIDIYCQEFSITEIENFFNEAAKFVLKKDKDWKKINKVNIII